MWLETLLSKEVTSQRIEIVTLSCFEIVVCVSVCVCAYVCGGRDEHTMAAHGVCSFKLFKCLFLFCATA